MTPTKPRWRSVLITLFLLLIPLALTLAVYVFGMAELHYYTPHGETVQRCFKGSTVAIEPPGDVRGYHFLGWRDAWGNQEHRQSITLYEDTYYSAIYIPALDTQEHMAYLFPDADGFLWPYKAMTRGDAALALYQLLGIPVRGGDSFLDVLPGSPYREATSALKELQVVSGSRFHPEEGVTRGELLEMLSHFFVPQERSFSFADLDPSDAYYAAFCLAAAEGWIESGDEVVAEPDHIMTRLETVRLLNRVLSREPTAQEDHELVGGILEFSSADPEYWELAEAAVSHDFSASDGKETWSGSSPLPKREAGLSLSGLDLYYITEEGSLLRSGEAEGFLFDENGFYTSGNEKLDVLVRQVLEQVVTPEMTDEEALRALYLYTRDSFSYLKRNYYETGDSSWLVDEAYTMLSTGRGNCYCYAATFCELTRALGYHARVVSGTIGHERSPHGWVEIEIDGTTYVFDTEIEMSYLRRGRGYENMYKMTYEAAARWSYVRAEWDVAA